ncbi:uncharacterized protein GGS25DRAFT_458183 [Hypoxylon fragiforme]|uniref:uncharacterized protein n=1 Tax=Hypoxylon fragiforme TaxID=63214 RepID=UPI0020C6D916|nr:uncharacterized protein GGS25DRAFT_458183 [Hypoxylon fragiforme]KAI2604369.1 hypothetical protein GGS25DRAFT_458183 [Hypoxylon fragiforme]
MAVLETLFPLYLYPYISAEPQEPQRTGHRQSLRQPDTTPTTNTTCIPLGGLSGVTSIIEAARVSLEISIRDQHTCVYVLDLDNVDVILSIERGVMSGHGSVGVGPAPDMLKQIGIWVGRIEERYGEVSIQQWAK